MAEVVSLVEASALGCQFLSVVFKLRGSWFGFVCCDEEMAGKDLPFCRKRLSNQNYAKAY